MKDRFLEPDMVDPVVGRNRAERRARASIARKVRLAPMPDRAPRAPLRDAASWGKLVDADPQAARAMLVEMFGAEHVEKRLAEIEARRTKR